MARDLVQILSLVRLKLLRMTRRSGLCQGVFGISELQLILPLLKNSDGFVEPVASVYLLPVGI